MKRLSRLVVASIAALAGASCHGAAPPSTPARPGAAAASPGAAESQRATAGSPAVGFALAESPLSLTSSDGTGLRLAALAADTVVDGPLAFTELRMTFDNPADRTIEGTFRITLPQGASLGRFAMKIEGAWQEGEVVELAAARRAYEDFLHRKQDPALLEKAAGNEFSARVFPIPARGTKELVVSWVEELHDGRYVLPLRGLPELGKLDVDVKVLGAEPRRMSAQNQTPAADFVVDVRSLPGHDVSKSAVRSGELAIVRVRPQTETKPDAFASAIILVDTSASRVLGFDGEIELVGKIAKRIGEEKGEKGTVTVACFDQTVAPIFDGRAADVGPRELAKIRERGALGASDLEHALAWAHDAAKKSGAKRIVLVTDGITTAGATDSKKLLAKVSGLREVGVERIDAVAIGGIRDDAGLLRIVRGNLARDGVVADGTRNPADVLRRLGEATRSGIPVKVEGATWSWPAKLDGVQAGDEYSVYAELPAAKELKVSLGVEAATAVPVRQTDRPLIERAVSQAKVTSMIDRVDAADPKARAVLMKSIVSIATRQRIMTPYTAMLVLESESDYQQYGIDRKSLSDVLAIQDGAVKRIHRGDVKLPIARPPVPEDDGRVDDARFELKALKDALQEEGGGSPGERPKPPSRPAAAAPPPPAPAEASKVSAGKKATEDREVSPSPRSRPRAEPAAAATAAASAAAASAAAAPRPMLRGPVAPRSTTRVLDRADSWSDAQGSAGGTAASGVARPPMAVEAATATEEEQRSPYEGKFATVMDQIKVKHLDEALKLARAWRAEAPGDVLALIALGEAAEANNLTELAARAYGSIVDLFSNRADLRRFAGERLERLSMKDGGALDLAIDSFEKALADRADHPSSHRLLTFALVRKRQFARAFDVALAGMRHGYEVDRFAGVDRILREDLGLVGAAWGRAEPARRSEIQRRVRDAGGRIEDQPSVRFVLNWETDANDVDFHIHDSRGGHAFYSQPHLPSGGDLYADVTTGYGPECFTIRGGRAKRSGPYKLEAHYYSRGPMGYGMGKLEVIDHDGSGGLTFEERPFVVMVDQAFVDLGVVR